MKLKQLFADDDAVSPVIGVILMVAITVILAAVIGTFVLGLGQNVQSTSPQASFAFDYTDGASEDTLTITHDGGDTIDRAKVDISITGATDSDGNPNQNWDPSTLGVSSSDMKAGTTATIDEANLGMDTTDDLDLSGATVKVVWTSQSGDSSATLGEFSGPDA